MRYRLHSEIITFQKEIQASMLHTERYSTAKKSDLPSLLFSFNCSSREIMVISLTKKIFLIIFLNYLLQIKKLIIMYSKQEFLYLFLCSS